jgi:putative transcriptional regulator
MPDVRMTWDGPSPPELTAEERAQIEALDRLSDEELTARALADPDNPPLTEDELSRLEMAAAVRNARARSGLTQAAFAAAYRLSLGRLRDLEQGRTRPDSAVLACLNLITKDPQRVLEALV